MLQRFDQDLDGTREYVEMTTARAPAAGAGLPNGSRGRQTCTEASCPVNCFGLGCSVNFYKS